MADLSGIDLPIFGLVIGSALAAVENTGRLLLHCFSKQPKETAVATILFYSVRWPLMFAVGGFAMWAIEQYDKSVSVSTITVCASFEPAPDDPGKFVGTDCQVVPDN